jgi:hypothetical protein
MFEGVSFKIENDCFIVISGLTGKVLHSKNLHEIRDRHDLIIYISSVLVRKWFTQQMHNMINRHVELLLKRF